MELKQGRFSTDFLKANRNWIKIVAKQRTRKKLQQFM